MKINIKDLPYTTMIVNKIIAVIEEPSTLLLPTANGTEFKAGYDTKTKEILDKLKTIKL